MVIISKSFFKKPFKKDKNLKAILANLQANAPRVAGRHTARQHSVGGLLQGVATITQRGQFGAMASHAGQGRGLLSLSLSLVVRLIYLVRSFGLGFLVFLNFLTFLNFSNPFTRFSFDFVAKFTNLQRFFINFIQIFTQKFTFSRFYGLLRRLCRLAMTITFINFSQIYTRHNFKSLKNSPQRSSYERTKIHSCDNRFCR